jgi:succinoglycan biosynthesis transport protein ExoP
MELADYLAVLRRRRLFFLVPSLVVLLVVLTAAYTLPPVYRSTATILIEDQGVPQELVETTVTGFVEERIHLLTQRLLTESKLGEIAEKLDLYPGERSADTMPAIVARMRKAITVEMVNVDVNNPRRSQTTQAAVSFTVSYDADKPEVAQKVASELANLFLEENRKERAQQSEGVTQFLKQEAERYRLQIVDLEKKLATFKQANIGVLPELNDLNLNFLNQTQNQLDRVEERIRSLEGQVASLQTQLSMTEPNLPTRSSIGDKPLLSVSQQLKALHAEYIEAQQRYTPEHPDVKRLKSQIAALQESIRNNPSVSFAPDSPAYISLKAQLESTRADLDSARQERLGLKGKLVEYETRLLKTPAVERDYLTLNRDYESAVKNYQDIEDKLQKAGLAQQLEEEAKGEQFTLGAPAELPSAPIKPNRPAIAFLGFVLAFGSGIGSVSLVEYLDPTVRGFRGVLAVLHAPPLAGIPYIETPGDRGRRRMRRLLSAVFLVLITVSALTLAHYYWKPIDQLWPQAATENGDNRVAGPATGQ